MMPPNAVMERYGLSDPVHIAETAIAHVWKVKRTDDDPAALKIYKDDDPKGEETGFALLQAINGEGAAKVYHFDQHIAVLEWLHGPSLGDLSRNGQDHEANALLIGVVDQIHEGPVDLPLTPLKDQFAALLQLQPDPNWADNLRDQMRLAQNLAVTLLENQTEIRTLHGDLHHDNVIQTPGGCRAIDPKGLIDDRAYDLANAFKNPVGAPTVYLDPERAGRMAALFGARWNTSPKRFLDWAVAHCALSITWANAFDDPTETCVLDMLIRLRADF